jgi:hypothetical protein
MHREDLFNNLRKTEIILYTAEKFWLLDYRKYLSSQLLQRS